MMTKNIKELKEVTEVALWACANCSAVTKDADVALKMADATERLSRSLSYLYQLKESEDK